MTRLNRAVAPVKAIYPVIKYRVINGLLERVFLCSVLGFVPYIWASADGVLSDQEFVLSGDIA